MNQKLFYTYLQQLNKQRIEAPPEERGDALLSIEKLLKDQTHLEPHNTELWIKLAIFEYTPPFQNPEIIALYLNKILEYDPLNSDALIIMAYVYNVLTPNIPNQILEKLYMITPQNQEYAAMIEQAKAWYY